MIMESQSRWWDSWLSWRCRRLCHQNLTPAEREVDADDLTPSHVALLHLLLLYPLMLDTNVCVCIHTIGVLLSGGSTNNTAPVKLSPVSILTAGEKENDHETHSVIWCLSAPCWSNSDHGQTVRSKRKERKHFGGI